MDHFLKGFHCKTFLVLVVEWHYHLVNVMTVPEEFCLKTSLAVEALYVLQWIFVPVWSMLPMSPHSIVFMLEVRLASEFQLANHMTWKRPNFVVISSTFI